MVLWVGGTEFLLALYTVIGTAICPDKTFFNFSFYTTLMEDLFTTQLQQGGGSMGYRVVFEEEAYRFIPDGDAGNAFALKREHDEWHAATPLPEEVKRQAIDALERYLLQQH